MSDNTNSAPVSSENLETSAAPEGENTQSTGAATPDAAKVAASKPAEVKKTIKKLKLKVDKGEIEEELPFELPDDPAAAEYMTKQLQLAKMGQKRAQEYSQLEKEVAQFLKDLKSNPRKVLSDPNIGVDLKQFAAAIIQEEIDNAQKSPEQLAKEQLEAELKQLKEDREREKEDFKQKELERLQAQEYERYDMLMTQALEKTDLPKSPYIVKKMADYMLLGLQNNIDMTPDEVVPLVREEMINDLKEMFGAMPEEVIESIIGKDTVNKLRKKKVAAVKAGAPSLPNKNVPDTGAKDTQNSKGSQEKKKQSYKEFFDF